MIHAIKAVKKCKWWYINFLSLMCYALVPRDVLNKKATKEKPRYLEEKRRKEIRKTACICCFLAFRALVLAVLLF